MPEERIGIVGGTFDPVHNGHLSLGRSVSNALKLDRVLFMPTGNPHFKLDQQVTPAAQRMEMVRLAIEGIPGFELDCREVRRQGVTYTVDTLEELRAQYPDARLFFIIGADSAETLVHWKAAQRMAQLATFVVTQRPGVDFDEVRRVHAQSPIEFDLEFVDVPQLDISSTDIRRAIACGESVEGLMPHAVIEYIRSEGLYRSPVASDDTR